MLPFVAIDVIAESRTFGSVWTIGTLAANRALRPVMLFTGTADIALPTSETIGLDPDRATRASVDDLDVTVLAVQTVAIDAWR
jgi:hypothetical protein